MIVMIDNYDSFVYNLVRYFKELGEEVVVYRNDKITIAEIEEGNYDGIVISPGPKTPKKAGICLEVIDKFKGVIPILGICLGHQCIGYSFGGIIEKGLEPVHGKVSLINHNNKGVFEKVNNPLRVTRYHSLVISRKGLPKDLEVLAETEDKVIMGIKHRLYSIYGVQFHPEAELTEDGHKILANFIKECTRFKRDEF